jgi:hypothetical protein
LSGDAAVGTLRLLQVIEPSDVVLVCIDYGVRGSQRPISLLAHRNVLLTLSHICRLILVTLVLHGLVIVIVVVMSVVIVVCSLTAKLRILIVLVVHTSLVPVDKHTLRLDTALLNYVLNVAVLVCARSHLLA